MLFTSQHLLTAYPVQGSMTVPAIDIDPSHITPTKEPANLVSLLSLLGSFPKATPQSPCPMHHRCSAPQTATRQLLLLPCRL